MDTKKKSSTKGIVLSSKETKQVPFAVVEAYKTIRTNLTFLLSDSESKTIAVTSPGAGEGKSTTSVNMAIAFSQLGEKVLLIDADMRRSSIHRKLKIENKAGLSNILAGFVKYTECVTAVNESLDVITAGQVPPNPSELLSSVRFKQFVDEVSQKYSYIIIDTPPVDVVTDALVIAPQTAGLLLVVRDKYTPIEAIEHAIAAAEFAGINILGAVMNGYNPKNSRGYGYRKLGYKYNKYRKSYKNYSAKTSSIK